MKKFIVLCVFFWVCHTTASLCLPKNKIDSLLNVLPLTEDGVVKVRILNALAFTYTSISARESQKYVTEALQMAREFNDKPGIAEAFKIYSLIFFVRGEYNPAMEYSYQALKIYEDLNDKPGQSKVLNNLGMIMVSQKEYGRAFDFTMQSLKLKREFGDSLGVANAMINIAEYYRHEGKYDMAMTYAKSALAVYDIFHDDLGTSYGYYTIGNIYESERKYRFAISYYQDAIRLANLLSDNVQIINITKQLGSVFLQSRQYDSAYYYLHKSLIIARREDSRKNEMETATHLAQYFRLRDRLDSALYYTQAAADIEREMFDKQRQEQVASFQMLYDFNKKEQELLFQKTIVKRQYVAIVGVTLILLLSVVFGFRVYALNKSNRMAKETLMKLNAEIQKINENLEGIVTERTQQIQAQNQKLMEYAFFTAHEVRGPVARILGLIELSKIRDLSDDDRRQIMIRLEDATTELDDIIRQISRKLENVKL
jgi:tetratricopeptide (TPR) repeat protein